MVIKGRLKPGRLTYFEDLSSGGMSVSSPASSGGTTDCINLRWRHLVGNIFKTKPRFFIVDVAHLLNKRSWKEAPISCLPASCTLSLSLEPDRLCLSHSRLLPECSLSDDVPESSLPGIAMAGTGSSPFTKASAVYSSMAINCLDRYRRCMTCTTILVRM